MDLSKETDKRQFYRLSFFIPICSSVRIVKFYNKLLLTDSSKACIRDIGPGGVRFLSDLRLPVTHNLLLEFSMNLLGQELCLYGYTVRVKKIAPNMYEYGAKFAESEQDIVVKYLNNLQVYMEKRTGFGDCSYCQLDERQCILVSEIFKNN